MPTAVDGAASTENYPCAMAMLFFFIQYLWVSNDWNIYSKVALSIQSAASCKKLRRYIRGCHVRTIHALMRMQKNVWTPTGLIHEGVEVCAWKMCSVLKRDVCHKLMAGMLFLARRGKLTPCNLLQMFSRQLYALQAMLYTRQCLYEYYSEVGLILGPHDFTYNGRLRNQFWTFTESGALGCSLKCLFPSLPDHIDLQHAELCQVQQSELGLKIKLNTRLFLTDMQEPRTKPLPIYLSWGVRRNADRVPKEKNEKYTQTLQHLQIPIKWVLWDTQIHKLQNTSDDEQENDEDAQESWHKNNAFLPPYPKKGRFPVILQTSCVDLLLNQGDQLVCAFGHNCFGDVVCANMFMHLELDVGTWAPGQYNRLYADVCKPVTLHEAEFADVSIAQYLANVRDQDQYLCF